MLLGGVSSAAAADRIVLAYPLTDPDHAAQWQPQHDVAALTGSDAGLQIAIAGPDPYIVSPPRDFPADTGLLLKVRLRSDTGGTAQIFYFDRHATEARSVRFPVPPGVWHEALVPIPPLGPGQRLRFDPPGGSGNCVLAALTFERPLTGALPTDVQPRPYVRQADDVVLTAGSLELRHAAARWNELQLSHGGVPLAQGHGRLPLGYGGTDQIRWLDLATATTTTRRMTDPAGIEVTATLADADGVRWQLRRTVRVAERGGFSVDTQVEVDQPRDVFFLPTLVVLPGFGTSGARKTQALLAGVEYLDDEPSSSTADLEGPAAERRVAAPHQLTFPLMAWQHDGRYVALSWRLDPQTAPLFDSPDRILQSSAHVLGLIAPGGGETQRIAGQILPHSPLKLSPDRPLQHQAWLEGGPGDSVVPAIRAYVERAGLPPLPPHPSLAEYTTLTAAGWLDSPLRDGARYRHAVGSGFPPQPALDAAWMLDWLSQHASDARLRMRLQDEATQAAAVVAAGSEFFSHVGHLQLPVAGLAFDKYDATRAQATAQARGLLRSFAEDGVAHYRAAPQGVNFARTHSSDTASGLAALPVERLLLAAIYAGDAELLAQGLERLRALDRFTNQVPRGAQTWEIPLHTPDILAAAHLVQAYVLAYRLTGKDEWLERARYWAWTGVPFVYLTNPTGQPVGRYSTIAVLGATNWVAPVWIGLPVQWCGLVYAASLRRLAVHDREGPWKTLADGITASAIQQSYPLDHPHRGLLPDSFELRTQTRNPADINPGTLQPLALEWLADQTPFDVARWPERRPWLLAAGRIEEVAQGPTGDSATIRPWRARGSWVVIHGLERQPEIWLNGRRVPADQQTYETERHSLRIRLSDATPVRLELRWPAPTAASREPR